MSENAATAIPPLLGDVPLPQNDTDPRREYGIQCSFPAVPASLADRNRRFQPYPATLTPSDLFTVGQNTCSIPGYQFIRKNDQRQMLMFCDGACSNNGWGGNSVVEPRGGCGVVFTCKEIMPNGLSSPLEINGIPHTNNRAELRAVILGLDLRFWPGGGFESLVIACDSEYVVLGICDRLQTWIKRGWQTSAGRPVANIDLWKELLERLRELEKVGCHVQFWKIPREWNEADKCAKQAAADNNPINNPPTTQLLEKILYVESL
ncbi:ribonuclease H-like protein [Terfezia boudieri ATCC MYA-4762]|uniref:ribonuclease H n=1 Tax=Terfezia boudieri ATCC MYA-4762 TaxID=1051890 RepID=A0A3N4M1G8_9PEZI|nr:ribonuclease H-like protein [Terfezia boudieri ATCC MYA-4762]